MARMDMFGKKVTKDIELTFGASQFKEITRASAEEIKVMLGKLNKSVELMT